MVTVHDLSFEHRPRDFTPYERAWHAVARPRRLVREAARVIAVSEVVRQELVEDWKLPPERVVTVPSEPGREPVGYGVAHSAGVRRPFVLAVGALEPRKRPDLLLEAHAYEDLDLCLRAADAGIPTLLRPAVSVRHLGGASVAVALAGRDAEIRARRRREVMARRGRLHLALDDGAQAATYATRAVGRKLLCRGATTPGSSCGPCALRGGRVSFESAAYRSAATPAG